MVQNRSPLKGILIYVIAMIIIFGAIYYMSADRQVDTEYSYSEFVYQTTGVDCVCERSATIADNAKLIIKKYSLDKVTIAVALIDYKIIF